MWVGSLGEAMDHLESQNGCDYEVVSCTYGCDEHSQRRKLKEHESEECPYRDYSCPHCGEDGNYEEITTNHYDECENYPVKCPNNCTEETIARCLLQDHRDNECPKEKVGCRYKSLGCEMKVERGQLDKHMEASKDDHLTLAMEKVVDLSLRVEELEKATTSAQKTYIGPVEMHPVESSEYEYESD